jgi:hypothetical protein
MDFGSIRNLIEILKQNFGKGPFMDESILANIVI